MTINSPHGDVLLDAPFILMSDVHIQHMADKRGRLLLDVLARLGPRVETLVLNGDICDFCFGDSDYYRRKFRPLGEALEGLVDRGIAVYFVEGNHEFHLERIGWDGVRIIQERDLVVNLRSGERLKIMHGDLLVDEPLYRAFRALLKSQAVRLAATLVPGGWLDAYSLRHAKFSRAQDRYRTLDHDRILSAFSGWLSAGDANHGIIGHFHVPYAEKTDDSARLMMSVDSWDKPNILIYDAGGFARVYLEEPELPFFRQSALSIFSGSD